jgi:hypothetical protein
MGRGNVAKAVVGRLGADARFAAVVGASFELQLDAPNAASSPSEMTVHAVRSGVQNFILFTSFLSDIATTLLALPGATAPGSVCQT